MSKRCYVDNAMNRRLGRVGMPLGSCVQSSSSSYGGSSYTSSSSSQRAYVDNPSNRQLGRVGEPVGSHVVHRDGSSTLSFDEALYSSSISSQRAYVDNSSNRQLGRVGKPVGSHMVHKDGSSTLLSDASYSSSSQRTYVDNSSNRQLGRVGKPVGSHMVHKDGSSTLSSDASYSSSFQRAYVDNSSNRQLGRVGKPVGSHVVHNDGSSTLSSEASYSSSSSSQRTYVDNSSNRRVGKPAGSHVVHNDGSSTLSSEAWCLKPTASLYYPTNQSLGGVGKPVGSHVSMIHKDGSSTLPSEASSSSSQRTYANNSFYRQLGQVGKPVGSHVVPNDGSSTLSSEALCLEPTASHYYYYPTNQSLGGVGKPDSSTLSSEASYSSSSSSHGQRTYANNSFYRQLGQVGKPVGSHVVPNDGSSTLSSEALCLKPTASHYPTNQSLGGVGGVGKPVGSHMHVVRSTTLSQSEAASVSYGVYTNIALNRKLERVGKAKGMHVLHEDGNVTISADGSSSVTKSVRRYVDNAINRKLNRVNNPIPSQKTCKPTSSQTEQQLLLKCTLDEIRRFLEQLSLTDSEYPALVNAQYELQRSEVEESWKESGIMPSTDPTIISKEIIPYEEIKLDKKIGEGGFGKVYAGLWKKCIPIAFKKLPCQQITKKKREQLVKEVKIFSSLGHPNIVKMFGVVLESDTIGIVMEYLQKTLFHTLFIEEISFSDAQKKKMINEIASALDYLHTSEPAIAHCDIKSQNILLDQENIAKLSDFGLSAMKKSIQSSSSRSLAAPGQGTPRYAAPEVLRGEMLSMSGLMMSDIYSLSLIVYEVLVEEIPFEDLGVNQLTKNIGKGDLRPSLKETRLTERVKQLLLKSWDKNPLQRPNVHMFLSEWSKIDRLVTEETQPVAPV